MFRNCNVNENCISDNEGFTLIELLVAIAILAVVAVPILRSFTMASKVNTKAQLVQSATSLAESILEDVKGKSIDDLKNDSHITVTEISDEGKITGYEVVYDDVTKTQGKTFDAVVTISTDSASVSAINNMVFPSFSQIDSSRNVVLSWEMNKYDGAALETLLDRNAVFTKEKYYDNTTDSIWWDYVNASPSRQILGHFEKTVDVKVVQSTDIDVNCQITYGSETDIPDTHIGYEPIKYEVYSYSVKDSENPDIYVFYTFMYDQDEVKNRNTNGITIYSNKETLNLDLPSGILADSDIYFILQKDKGAEENYVLNYENDGSLLVKYYIWGKANANYLTLKIKGVDKDDDGFSLNGHRLYTNIPYTLAGGTETNLDGNLYSTEQKETFYDVEVKVYNRGDRTDSIATLNSTMKKK